MVVSLSQAWEALQDQVNHLIATLPRIGLALVIFALFYWASRWVRSAIKRVTEAGGLSPHAGLMLRRLSRWVIIVVGLLIALSIAVPSFTTGQLIQLLGIGSVAIGFAFRNVLENFLAGFLLLLSKPFKVGDQIIVNDFEGTVENIETRATTGDHASYEILQQRFETGPDVTRACLTR